MDYGTVRTTLAQSDKRTANLRAENAMLKAKSSSDYVMNAAPSAHI